MDASASTTADEAAGDRLSTTAGALLRLPELVLGGMRALALEAVVILGVGSAIAFVSYLVTYLGAAGPLPAQGRPHIFADIWTAGTYIAFVLGAPLAAATLLDDLLYPDTIEWWPGAGGTRTRFRMPSTTLLYLPFDAIPPAIVLLALGEPRARVPLFYVMVGVTLAVCLAVAVTRVVVRTRHGPIRRLPDAHASVEVPPRGARAAAGVAGIVVPLVALVTTLALRGAGALEWLWWMLAYVVYAALLKIALAQPARATVAPPPASSRSRRSRRKS